MTNATITGPNGQEIIRISREFDDLSPNDKLWVLAQLQKWSYEQTSKLNEEIVKPYKNP